MIFYNLWCGFNALHSPPELNFTLTASQQHRLVDMQFAIIFFLAFLLVYSIILIRRLIICLGGVVVFEGTSKDSYGSLTAVFRAGGPWGGEALLILGFKSFL